MMTESERNRRNPKRLQSQGNTLASEISRNPDDQTFGKTMEFAKVTARGQTTIPKSIREAANLGEGDVIAFEIEGNRLVVHKVTPRKDEYRQGLSEVLSEWVSPEDEEAWRDL